jgi:Domain of unknown function (DUF5667)
MARKLDDIFNECYERIRSGESLESCLRSYPQYRGQLELLLKTTFDIGRRVSYIHPRPEFKHWAQVRIESAQRYPRQPAMAEAPASSTWLRHGWAVIVSIGIVLLLTTGSTMAASSQALPDQALYPVKLFTEDVQRVVTVSPDRKAQLETDIANIRAVELEAMANAGKTQEAAKAAERYNDQFERAIQVILTTGGTETKPATYVPPAVTTSPAVTAPPANITSSTTTTIPVVTPPPVITVPTENITPPVVSTPPAVTIPTENATAIKAITTPPIVIDARTERLIISLNKSTSKGVTALQDAKGKAEGNQKDDWQKALDNLKSWSGDEATTSKSDNVIENQGNKNTGGTSLTTVSDNNTTTNSGNSSHNKPSSSNWRQHR